MHKRILAALIFFLPVAALAAVTTTTSRQESTASGTATNFTFTFPVQRAADVEVYLDGTKQTSGFTTTINANQTLAPGGSVTFVTAPAVNAAVKIQRATPKTQESSWAPYAPFAAKSLEKALDRLAMQTQEIERDRADTQISLDAYKATETTARQNGDAQLQVAVESARADFQAGAGGFTDNSAILATGTTSSEKIKDVFAKVFRPEQFGAKCDGVTDDYVALQALVAAVNSKGGGTVEFPAKATCKINRYRIDGGGSANGITDLIFSGVNGLVINGNGAKIDAFGAYIRPADYFTSGKWYTYSHTIGIRIYLSNNVVIRDLEMDGNNQDTTRGTAVEGIDYGFLIQASNDIRLDRVYSHHYPTDGLAIGEGGPSSPYTISRRVTVTNSRFEYNGRQGMSITGLRWGSFSGNTFAYQGKSVYGGHAPQGGIDIEPARSPGTGTSDEYTGDISFVGDTFIGNVGTEFTASNVTTATYPINVYGSRFIGIETTSRIIPASKYMTFDSCYFKDTEIKPGFSFGTTYAQNLTISNSVVENSIPTHRVILWENNGDASFTFTKNRVISKSPSVPTPSFRYWMLSTWPAILKVTDNYFFAAGTEHPGSGRYDYGNFQGTGDDFARNSWVTDLAVGANFFALYYNSNGTIRNERYYPASTFSPNTSQFFGAALDQGGGVGAPYLELGTGLWTYTSRKIYYGTAAPTTGTFTKGDIVLNYNATTTGALGWYCTTGGVDGAAVWTALHPVGMTQSAAQADSVAADVATLKTDFNALLAKLRTAKLLAP